MNESSETSHKKNFLDSKVMEWLWWIAAWIAPLPLWGQVYKLMVVDAVDAILLESYLMLCPMHFLLALKGLKQKATQLAVNFFLTSLAAFCICIVYLERGGRLFFF